MGGVSHTGTKCCQVLLGGNDCRFHAFLRPGALFSGPFDGGGGGGGIREGAYLFVVEII